MVNFPNFAYEDPLISEGFVPVGIDEVGRGAFAGPVGIGGVVFPKLSEKDKKELLELGINDSKKLTPKKRLELSIILKQICLFEVSFINVETINKIGIGNATFLGMQEVARKLLKRVEKPFFLVDAFTIPKVANQKGIIRGDSLSISIASASIIAKVERDVLMENLAKIYPNYGFEHHKGYGTSVHRKNIKKYGASCEHRVAFCSRTLTSQ